MRVREAIRPRTIGDLWLFENMTLPDAQNMAHTLMRYHGLHGYTFSYMQRRDRFHRAGQCNWKRKRIQLAPRFVESNHPFIVKRTILHEIAHGLRPRHHHNKYWSQTALQIGATGRRCYGREVKR